MGFTLASVFALPFFFMFRSAKAERLGDKEADGTSDIVVDRLPTEQIKDSLNFFGCGHCNQVFTERRALEVHTRFIHPDLSYKEVLSPMPRRFAEVMSTPAIMEGVPLSEVKKHKTKSDCWCVINGKVYDLTSFVDSHPGGPNPILSWAGRDASKAWNLIHQTAWLTQYAAQFECLGPLAPEPPVEGMTPIGAAKQEIRVDVGKEATAGSIASGQASSSLLGA